MQTAMNALDTEPMGFPSTNPYGGIDPPKLLLKWLIADGVPSSHEYSDIYVVQVLPTVNEDQEALCQELPLPNPLSLAVPIF